MRGWTGTQWMCLVLGVVLLAHSIGGMIVNPDFGTGGELTSVMFVGIDFNGWHALLGIVFWATSIAAATRADLARVFAIAAVGVDVAIGVWALIDARILGILYLPSISDAILHLSVAALFAVTLLLDARRRTAAPAAA